MKPLAFVLLVLVGSMILTNIPSQGYADPQLDSLLRIANQARDNIKIRLSQLATIPNEIAKLYEQGSAETNALAKSVAKEDISSSKQHFLSAMRLFKDASDKLSSESRSDSTLSPPPDTLPVKNAITRIEKVAERLKAVAAQNNVNIDFTEFDKLMQTARQNLEAGNIDEVYKTLETAKQFLLKNIKIVKSTPKTPANEVSNASPQTADETTNATPRPDSMLEKIRMKIQTLEEQLNSLSEKASGNDTASQWLKRAFSLIEKAKDQLDKSPEKAMRTLNEVDKIVHMIQRITQ